MKESIDPEDRESVLGCYCFMGVALGSWSNKKERTVSAYNDNAKRIALGRALKAGVWMRHFLIEIGLGEAGKIMLDGDRATMSRAYQ